MPMSAHPTKLLKTLGEFVPYYEYIKNQKENRWQYVK